MEPGSGSGKPEEIFREVLSRSEAGDEVDPEEYIRRHPELEADLKKFFEKLKRNDVEEIDLLAEPEEPRVPKVIGDFKILGEIGRGGMGVVYEAVQMSLRRPVALKVLPSHLSFSNDAVAKFQREAEAGGRQSHPAIVAVHAVGVHEGVHFIAQELVKGGTTLADRLEELRREKKIPSDYFREAAALVAEIADALQHAHDCGVIHRDVKPSNILLTGEGKPKVTDFGLAKVEDALALSRTGEFAGTPYYMSPEQAASRRIGIDHRTDIFSLGATLYEMLTLERPFPGETSQEVLKKILLDDPRDPRKLNPRIYRDLAVICLKALEKKPEARYAAMKDLAADLRRFLSGDIIEARPVGPVTRLWKQARRRPAVLTAAGTVLLAAIVVLPLLWSYQKDLAERERELDEKERQLSELEDTLQELLSDAEEVPEYLTMGDTKTSIRATDVTLKAKAEMAAPGAAKGGLPDWVTSESNSIFTDERGKNAIFSVGVADSPLDLDLMWTQARNNALFEMARILDVHLRTVLTRYIRKAGDLYDEETRTRIINDQSICRALSEQMLVGAAVVERHLTPDKKQAYILLRYDLDDEALRTMAAKVKETLDARYPGERQ